MVALFETSQVLAIFSAISAALFFRCRFGEICEQAVEPFVARLLRADLRLGGGAVGHRRIVLRKRGGGSENRAEKN